MIEKQSLHPFFWIYFADVFYYSEQKHHLMVGIVLISLHENTQLAINSSN